MDFDKFFRSFFGLEDKHRRDFPRPPVAEEDGGCTCGDHNSSPNENNHHEFHFFFDNEGHPLDDMFRHFHGGISKQMESLQQQMDDMLKGFGTIASDNRPGIRDTPESYPNGRRDWPFFFHTIQPYPRMDKKAPRDFMLKENEEEESKTPKSLSPLTPPSREDSKSSGSPLRRFFLKEEPRQDQNLDTDLDTKLSSADAVDLIRKSTKDELPKKSSGKGFFSGSSVTVTTVTGPDGKTEHKRVVRDSSGREESTVSRSVDGQCHTVTTIKGPNGLEEKREDFKNMDENDLQKFQEKWTSQHAPQRPTFPTILEPSTRLDARDMDLFSRLFGPPPK